MLDSEMKDFEDAVQTIAAKFNYIEIILTQNKEAFSESRGGAKTPK